MNAMVDIIMMSCMVCGTTAGCAFLASISSALWVIARRKP